MAVPIKSSASCETDILICDKAVQGQKKVLELSNLAIVQLQDQVQVLSVRAEEAEDSLGAWYRNPYILVGIGFVTGVLVAK